MPYVDDRKGELTPDRKESAGRATVAAGITTKFHASSLKNAPDEDRSPDLAVDIAEAVGRADGLMADHRIHARSEVSDETGVSAAIEILDRRAADLVSIMCHLPGKGQFQDVEKFLEWHRSRGEEAYDKAKQRLSDAGDVDDAVLRANVDRVVAHAQEIGVPVASHDDESPTEVERVHERGVPISEFPVSMPAAKRARDLGMTVAMGAPNLVRGGSQWGNLGTQDAIDAGCVDVLVADYHPPSMLVAPFVDTGEPLVDRVARVTSTPAEAVGLDERGRIEPGARADLVVVATDPTPVVERAFIAGRPVYRAEATDR